MPNENTAIPQSDRKWSWMRLFGFVLLIAMLLSLDWQRTYQILLATNPIYIVFAGLCNFAFIILKAMRWHSLLKLQDIHYGFGRALRIYQAGSFFSVITPGRVGDLIKVSYLKRDLGVLHRFGLVSVIFDRLFDLASLGMSALIFVFLEQVAASFGAAVIGFLILFLVGCFMLFSPLSFRFGLQLARYVPVLGTRVTDKEDELEQWHESLRNLLQPGLIIPLLFSCLAYGALFFGGYLLALGQQIPISFVQVGYCIALANVVALLPFSVAGVGTRDVAIVLLFATFGLAKEQALYFSLGYLFVNLIFANTLGGIYWFQESKRSPMTSGHA